MVIVSTAATMAARSSSGRKPRSEAIPITDPIVVDLNSDVDDIYSSEGPRAVAADAGMERTKRSMISPAYP